MGTRLHTRHLSKGCAYLMLVEVSSLISGSCYSVMNVFECVITCCDSLRILYLCNGRGGGGGGGGGGSNGGEG